MNGSPQILSSPILVFLSALSRSDGTRLMQIQFRIVIRIDIGSPLYAGAIFSWFSLVQLRYLNYSALKSSTNAFI